MKWPAWLKHKPKPVLMETAPVQSVSLLGALSPLGYAEDTLPGGEGIVTYRKMQHDPQIKACLSTKKAAVLSRGWEISPASTSDSDVYVADFVRQCLTQMSGSVLDVLYDALDALALGISILELNWCLREDGKIGLSSIKAKDPALFFFETDPFLNITAIKNLLTEADLPVDKFVLYAFQPSYANPMGLSDLRAAWQPWFVKQQMLRWWAKYLEKFGMPTVAGSYDAKAGYGVKQQREFLSLLAGVHNESALVMPSDFGVKLLEATRSADSGFNDAIAYCDRSMAKSLLGQSLTSDSSDRNATYALGAVQANVLSFYLQKLQRDLEDTVMNEQVLKRLIGYNFPPGTPVPTFHLGRVDDDRLAATAQLMTALISGGVVSPEEPWIRSYLGLPARTPSA
jgi:phage gp29-like protein